MAYLLVGGDISSTFSDILVERAALSRRARFSCSSVRVLMTEESFLPRDPSLSEVDWGIMGMFDRVAMVAAIMLMWHNYVIFEMCNVHVQLLYGSDSEKLSRGL